MKFRRCKSDEQWNAPAPVSMFAGEGLISQGQGPICDLSSTGCFVLTGGQAGAGELIRLEIHSPNQVALVWGQVVYGVAEIGLALRFASTSEDEMRTLERLIDNLPGRDSRILYAE